MPASTNRRSILERIQADFQLHLQPDEEVLAVGWASDPPSPRNVMIRIAVLVAAFVGILIVSVPLCLYTVPELGFIGLVLVAIGIDLIIFLLIFSVSAFPLLWLFGDHHWFVGVSRHSFLLIPAQVEWRLWEAYPNGRLLRYPYQRIQRIVVKLRPLVGYLSMRSADGRDVILLFPKRVNSFASLIDVLINLRPPEIEFVMG